MVDVSKHPDSSSGDETTDGGTEDSTMDSSSDHTTNDGGGGDSTSADSSADHATTDAGRQDGANDASKDGSSVVPPLCTPGSSTCNDDASAYAVCDDAGEAYVSTGCLVGCSTDGGAHCLTLYPSPPVSTTDLTVAGVEAITLGTGTTIFNTNDGSITGGLTRSPNALNTAVEVKDGIAFHQSGTTGIWSFGDLTIPNGATLKILGLNAAALVSNGTLLVDGVIDARPMDGSGNLCPDSGSAGPGAYAGGSTCNCGPGGDYGAAGAGPGGGMGGQTGPGISPATLGGGAGHAAVGGTGGLSSGGTIIFTTSGGAAYDAATHDAAAGGSGGGESVSGGLGLGGGGGGVVTLVAAYVISIGDGLAVEGVNAGGCGGWSGGGGGSGGTVLLEAPFVQLGAKSTLAANGGSGGPSGTDAGNLGSPGGLGSAPATSFGYVPSTVPGSCPGVGPGGAGDSPAGGNTAACAGASGGGGGAAGYVLVRTMTGAPTQLSSLAVISPSLDSGAAAFGVVPVR
jgi:hypothetical protein